MNNHKMTPLKWTYIDIYIDSNPSPRLRHDWCHVIRKCFRQLNTPMYADDGAHLFFETYLKVLENSEAIAALLRNVVK